MPKVPIIFHIMESSIAICKAEAIHKTGRDAEQISHGDTLGVGENGDMVDAGIITLVRPRRLPDCGRERTGSWWLYEIEYRPYDLSAHPIGGCLTYTGRSAYAEYEVTAHDGEGPAKPQPITA